MDTKTFFENFETIANAPGGIARLRELILDLAVRGRILSDRVSSTRDDSGFPLDWTYKTLDEVAEYVQRGKGPKYATKGDVVVVSQKCVKWSGFDISEARFIDDSSVDSYKDERYLRPGDLLWNSTGTGTVGRTALFIDVEGFPKVVADSHVTVIRAPKVVPRFLWIWSASPIIQSAILSSTTGSTNQQELNLSTIKGLSIVLPPVEEQNSIVAKVDELMALCDQLEEAQRHRDSLRTSARNSAIDAISTASTAEELGAAWKRINQNWTTFADTPESISSLRTLILKSAGEGKLQRNSATPKSGPRASLGELCDIYQPKTISKNELIEDGKYLVYGANGVIGRYDKFNHEFEEVTVTCRGATCGTVNVTAPKSWINGNAMVVRPKVDELTKEFLAVILRGLDYETVITGSAQPQITRQPLAKVLIWIPKLAEQQKIVFQVDRLMSLCDVLESALLKQAELEEQISRAVTSEVAA